MSVHQTDPAYIVDRLTWLLEDLVEDDRPLTAAELRNVLAGRDLLDPAGEVAAA